jgi:hypothetical protein
LKKRKCQLRLQNLRKKKKERRRKRIIIPKFLKKSTVNLKPLLMKKPKHEKKQKLK